MTYVIQYYDCVHKKYKYLHFTKWHNYWRAAEYMRFAVRYDILNMFTLYGG